MGQLNRRGDATMKRGIRRLVPAVMAAVAVGIATLTRSRLGQWSDARNIEALRRRYDLDHPTATRLYHLARTEGFGAAWQQVIDDQGRRDREPPSR